MLIVDKVDRFTCVANESNSQNLSAFRETKVE